jgi:hypothetical protein
LVAGHGLLFRPLLLSALPIGWRNRVSSLSLSEEPSSFVNIELYQTFASHFQQKGLAGFLIHDIGAFHDLIDFERLLAERVQDILSVI